MSRARKKSFTLPWRSASQIRADVDEELRFHLDMRVDALVAAGLTPDAARQQAMREFGDINDARSYIGAVDRDIEAAQRRSDIMRDLWTDIGYAVRKLRSAPAFTAAAIITLALGVGATTAMFSVVNRVLLQPLPFPQADHLVRVVYTQQGHGDVSTPMDLVDNRTQATNFTGFSVVEPATANLIRAGADAERVQGVRVNANWFDLLRVKPLAGRYFATGEDQRGAANVVVLSEQLWTRDFGANPNVVGSVVRINAQPYTVIGVVPAMQRLPLSAELWMPKIFGDNELSDNSRGARWLGLYARVKDGVDVERAGAEVTRISEAMEKRFPELFRERRARIATVQSFATGDMRKPLLIMLGAVALVLLIACSNVANLMLVRATARESEMAIRTALGAGRGRLARQLMTESVILSLCGAGVGLLVAKLGTQALLARAPNLPLLNRASIDGTTLLVTAVVAIVTGLVFGVLPAAQVGRNDLATALRAGARGTRTQPSAHRTKRAIVIAEVALAVTLLTGAGLLLHSFVKLLSVDTGFRPEGVISMKVALPQRAYDSTAMRNFMRTVEERARALPGATSVGISNFIPLDGGSFGFTFGIRGRPAARPSDEPDTEVRQVTADFFTTLGIPVLNGRAVTAADQPATAKVLVVNRAFVKRFFPNDNPVGQAITLGWGEDGPNSAQREIVGVVGDVRSSALAEDPAPTVYVPIMQAPFSSLSILVRTAGSPASLATPLRAIIRDIDHDVPVFSVQTMEERVAASVGPQRFYATLIAIFAAIALVLSAVGLYGVIAYAVSQRAHELGVRVALGATGDRIAKMVVGEGLTLAAIGAAIGILGSLLAGKLVGALLFGVTASDPVTLGGVILALGVVAALASWLPARRAARADPLVAMRGD